MRRESQEVRPRSRTVIELDIAGLIIIIIIMTILMIAMILMILMILMMIIMKFMMTSDIGPFFRDNVFLEVELPILLVGL